ncbi:hypothetical protein ACH5RR_017584 [Cinchona calisaya]|uniref:Stigma-specific STIG1-like protein 1 n=1 Tax=Cinchona calisaya TaxID=153742 RepID=A0ABD2ZMK7_9GENT
MEAPRLFILLLIILSSITIINIGALDADDMIDEEEDSNNFDDFSIPDYEGSNKSSRRISGRFLAQKQLPANYTCDSYPRVCHLKGSAGPDCCYKKCVNVETDSLNCFMCGNKCKFGEKCCKGKCKNVFKDKKHCGGCNIKCKSGDRCEFGMCNYA